MVGTATPTLEEGDTLTLVARPLDGHGAVVTDVSVVWQVLDTGTVGFTLDSTTGYVVATAPGQWRVRALADSLPSGILTLTITPAPDSLAAASAPRDTVASGQTDSSPLAAIVFDLTTSLGQQLPLQGKSVHFAVVDPMPGSPAADGIALAVGTSVPAADPRQATVITGTSGQAAVFARRTTVAAPDSAVIEATAQTVTGTIVSGSPVRFIVVFINP